jgi:nitrite reductase/ring-hydroxylating ferredoxin subunit
MNNEKYSRYEFLRKMGFSGGALMAVLGSCTVKKDAVLDSLIVNSKGQPVVSLDSTTASATTVPPTTTIGSGTTGSTTNLSGLVTTDQLNTIKSFIVKVDLTASTATALKNDGGYVIVNGSVVVANVTGGQYVAAQNLCTHQPRPNIIFNRTEYYCTDHGARFALSGAGLNSLGSRGLTVYRTANDGKTLVVFA